MSLAVWVVGIYGLFSLVGGMIGYLKAKSQASLIAGSLSGVSLFACAYGIMHESRVAALVSLVIAALLGGRFVGTWRRTHRVMPDLLMVVLSLATIVTVSLGLRAR